MVLILDGCLQHVAHECRNFPFWDSYIKFDAAVKVKLFLHISNFLFYLTRAWRILSSHLIKYDGQDGAQRS